MATRILLKKVGALALSLSGLLLLMTHAALTHGCGGTRDSLATRTPQGENPAVAPATATTGSTPTSSANYAAVTPNRPDKDWALYMGATKAPPLDAFRGYPPNPAPMPQQQAGPSPVQRPVRQVDP